MRLRIIKDNNSNDIKKAPSQEAEHTVQKFFTALEAPNLEINKLEKSENILRLKNIAKTYFVGDNEVKALEGIDLEVSSGEFVAILGPSGSGKTTLMNIIGCLDSPTLGTYELSGNDISRQSAKKLANIRNRQIGFVFQQFQLLPRLNIVENVEVPLIYAGIPHAQRRRRAIEILRRVGLGDKLSARPSQLSGGQQQRVAIARALITEPAILLADEPTGALDQATGKQILALFEELNREGKTIIMITHDSSVAKNARRIINIVDGKLSEVAL